MGQGMVRVDRGDGKLFQFSPNEAALFIAANPGAHVVPGRRQVEAQTPAEVAATEPQSLPEPEVADESEESASDGKPLEALTVAQLRDYAAVNGVDLEGAKTKAEIIERFTTETEKEPETSPAQ